MWFVKKGGGWSEGVWPHLFPFFLRHPSLNKRFVNIVRNLKWRKQTFEKLRTSRHQWVKLGSLYSNRTRERWGAGLGPASGSVLHSVFCQNIIVRKTQIHQQKEVYNSVYKSNYSGALPTMSIVSTICWDFSIVKVL